LHRRDTAVTNIEKKTRIRFCGGSVMAKSRVGKRAKQRVSGKGESGRNGKARPQAGNETSRFFSGRRIWFLRIGMALVAPLVFLLLAEAVLSLAHFGYPTTFFIESEQDGVLTTNARFGWHYQQQTVTTPHPCLFGADKPEDAVRIFVLGESAAVGTPDPAFGFIRQLELMLKRQFPTQRLEVINAAMRGINSHVILPIARECAALEPDLLVIYVGNNEVNGLYAPKTPSAFFGRHPGLIPVFHRAKQSRTGQLLRRVLRAHPEAYQEEKHTRAPDFFDTYHTRTSDAGRQGVYRNFQANLRRICQTGLDAGAAVIVSTVAVNLRDCPPLASLHRGDLMQLQRGRWDSLYQQGVAAEKAGDNAKAVGFYEEAAVIDDQYAELHFRLGRCAQGAGDPDKAKRHFALARDRDALQFRTDSRLNEIIRAVAEQQEGPIQLVDVEKILADCDGCPDGIPGSELFYEHVHFRFDGDYEMAAALLPAVVDVLQQRRGLSPAEAATIPTRAECAALLGFTRWDEVNTAAGMAQLTAKPPFTGQLEHAARQARADKAISSVMDRVDKGFINEVIQSYGEAIEANPEDWHLHYNLATFLHQLGRSPEAAREFDTVVRALPHVNPYRTLLAYALGRAGLWDRAIYHFGEVLRRDSQYAPARDGLGWAQKAAGK